MKKIIPICILLLMFLTDAFAQSQNNWVRTKTYTEKNKNDYYEDIAYYDGLGYQSQVVNRKASPSYNDVITPVYYDNMRRNSRNYLPYVPNRNTGEFDSDAYGNQRVYYGVEGSAAFSITKYDGSPLSRAISTTNAGNVFHDNGKKVTFNYCLNNENEVYKLIYSKINDNVGFLCEGFHEPGTLGKVITVNEDGSTIIKFTNQRDMVILERMEVSENYYADTYYVYDNLDRLACIVSPEGSKMIPTFDIWNIFDSEHSKLYCYAYKYDSRGQIIEKKLPGKDVEYLVYDKMGRVVLTQDGNLRQSNRWLYNVYDNMNRLVDQTIVSSLETAESIREMYRLFANTYDSHNSPLCTKIPFGNTDLFNVEFNLAEYRYGGYAYAENNYETLPGETISVPLGPVALLIHDSIAGQNLGEAFSTLLDDPFAYLDWRNRDNTDGHTINPQYFIGEYEPEPEFKAYFFPEYFFEYEITIPPIMGGSSITINFFQFLQEATSGAINIVLIEEVSGIPEVVEALQEIVYISGCIDVIIPQTQIYIGKTVWNNVPAHLAFCDVENVAQTQDVYDNGNDIKIYEKIYVLDGQPDRFIERAFYYDSKGRVIQTVEKNYLGGISRYSTKYDFSGNILTSHESHQAGANRPVDIKRVDFTYDHRGRLLTEKTAINDSEEALVKCVYDELGKLISKTYGKTGNDLPQYIDLLTTAYFVINKEYIAENPLASFLTHIIAEYDPYGKFMLDYKTVKPEYFIEEDSEYSYYYIPQSCAVNIMNMIESSDGAYEYTFGPLFSNWYRDRIPNPDYIPGNSIVETYDYNIQGWLTSKSSDLFEMQLRYYDPLERTWVKPRYTGNIAELRWQHHDAQPGAYHQANSYGFAYDNMGRLRANDHMSASSVSSNAWVNAALPFQETNISYDLNGNILSLGRTELVGDPANPTLDSSDFRYGYTGNQLTLLGYQDPMGSSQPAFGKTYSYDANGNTAYDERKNLYFQYNYLNLVSCISEPVGTASGMVAPLSLMMSGGDGEAPDDEEEGCTGGGGENPGEPGNTGEPGEEDGDPGEDGPGCIIPPVYPPLGPGNTIASYVWLANGAKMAVVGSDGKGYVYLGSLVYKADGDEVKLESTGFGAGRIQKTTSGYDVNYQITDHLGSVRVVFNYGDDDEINVMARNDYYSFGKRHDNSSLLTASDDSNRWLYNGKEAQSVIDRYGVLDYGARMYDPEIGRWNSVDPMAEKTPFITPYHFTGNNPINRYDPDGREDDWVMNNETSEYVWMDNVTSADTTPEGYRYIGPTGMDILADIGIQPEGYEANEYDEKGMISEGIGFFQYSLVRMNVFHSIKIEAMISKSVENATENNAEGRKFEGIIIRGYVNNSYKSSTSAQVTFSSSINAKTATGKLILEAGTVPYKGGYLRVPAMNTRYETAELPIPSAYVRYVKSIQLSTSPWGINESNLKAAVESFPFGNMPVGPFVSPWNVNIIPTYTAY